MLKIVLCHLLDHKLLHCCLNETYTGEGSPRLALSPTPLIVLTSDMTLCVSNLAFDDQANIFAHPAILPSPHPANLNMMKGVMEESLAILIKMARRIGGAQRGWLGHARGPGTRGASGAVKAKALHQR